MMLVGFGYLMAFLKCYGLGAVGFTLCITCLALQMNILLRPLIPHGEHLVINSTSLLDGHFAAATVLISFGALIGKASPTQLIVITVVESLLFQINRNIICEEELQFADTGGTIVIHLFGAYFGLACAYVLGKPPDDARTAAMASVPTPAPAVTHSSSLPPAQAQALDPEPEPNPEPESEPEP